MVDDLKKFDSLEKTDRTFHSVLTYRVWVEIDEIIRSESDMITGISYPDTTKM